MITSVHTHHADIDVNMRKKSESKRGESEINFSKTGKFSMPLTVSVQIFHILSPAVFPYRSAPQP